VPVPPPAAKRRPVMQEIDVAAARRLTPGVEQVVHLNNAGAALMPDVVTGAMRAQLALEESCGGYEAAEQSADQLSQVYGSVARLIGCSPGEIAFTDSASRAWALAFRSIPLEREDRVLASSIEYGSNHLSMLHAVERRGAALEIIPNDNDGHLDVGRLAEMLDDRVRVLAVTHVPCNGGQIMPIRAVGALAAERGIPLIVDACQSAGHLSLDVRDIQCDFLVAAGRKYLRGPRGTAFLYSRLGALAWAQPDTVGLDGGTWLGHNQYEFASGASRFETWETDVIARLGLGAAVDYALKLGIDNIWRRIDQLATYARRRLRAVVRVRMCDQGRVLSGLITFDVPGVPADLIRRRLRERSINIWNCLANTACVDMEHRRLESLLRVSVHYYNTVGEIDDFCAALEEIIAFASASGTRIWHTKWAREMATMAGPQEQSFPVTHRGHGTTGMAYDAQADPVLGEVAHHE
jgi:cysteine desulfurase / selenocysteine lyase